VTDPPEDHPPKSPVEQAVETFVYAPIGLLFDGASLLPQLVEKGRSQVTMAKMIGRFAVEQGRTEATKAAAKIQDQAAGVLDFIGGGITPMPPADEAPAPAPAAPAPRPAARRRTPAKPGAARAAARKVAGVAGDGATANAEPAPRSARATTRATTGAASAPAASASELAIPDYDGLSASHVVNRLGGLSAAELEAVRRYEAANRGRKTILSKVAQLQSG
jgi:hypothetical protein